MNIHFLPYQESFHDKALHFLSKCERWVTQMPLAQGILVMMALGITIGTLSYEQTELFAQFIRLISATSVLIFGIASLYVLSHDRRYPRRYLQIAVFVLLALDLSYFVPFTYEAYMIIHGLCILTVSVVLFLMSVRHGLNHGNPNGEDRRKYGRHRLYR